MSETKVIEEWNEVLVLQVKDLIDERNRLNEEIDRLTEQIAGLENDITEKDKQLSDLEDDKSNLECQVDDLKSDVYKSLKRLFSEIDDTKTAINSLEDYAVEIRDMVN